MRNHGIFQLAASASIAIAMAGSAAAQESIKIGMVMPLTGTLADAGKQVVAGARLYMAEHSNTIAGKRIELIVKDDTSSFETGKRLIQEAIVNDKVNVIGGGLTGDLFASAPVITEAKVPTVIMISSTSGVIDKSPYYVRTSTTMAQESTILADWAIDGGTRKVVTLVSDFAPGLEAEATFRERYLAAGGQIAESIHVPLRSPDFAPFLQRARDDNPQAIFVFVPSVQAGTLAKEFAERGLDKSGIKLIGPGDIADDALLPNVGDVMLGTVTASFYSAAHTSPENVAFVDAYRKLTGERANFMAVSGYDGMHLIYEALRKTNGSIDGDALVSTMKGMSWESPRGPMSIDPATGEVIHNIYIGKVERRNGELYSVEFATFKAVKDARAAAK
jgi:branched-chain amino acid transport system substrate-binding protein